MVLTVARAFVLSESGGKSVAILFFRSLRIAPGSETGKAKEDATLLSAIPGYFSSNVSKAT